MDGFIREGISATVRKGMEYNPCGPESDPLEGASALFNELTFNIAQLHISRPSLRALLGL